LGFLHELNLKYCPFTLKTENENLLNMGLHHRFKIESLSKKLADSEIHEMRMPLAGKLNIVLIFPNSYALGMSNLGYLTVHRIMGSVNGVGVERFFHPILENAAHTPPFYSFDTKRPLGDFDILAFSFSVESDFAAIPRILGPLGIPILAEKRTKRHPLLMAGGAAVGSNPQALSRVFDVLVSGEAETVLPSILQTFMNAGLDPRFLIDLPGVWIPQISASPNLPEQYHDVNVSPAYSHIISGENIFGGASLIELMRGCPRFCNFCLASRLYAPPREVSLRTFEEWLNARSDVKELGLIAPSLFDHGNIEEILDAVHRRGIRLKNSSVKWERLNDRILNALSACNVNSLTLAPESGSVSLRNSMRKSLQEANFFDTIGRIRDHGFDHLKFYFMIGLPSETDDDLDATIQLISKVHEIGKGRFKGFSASFSGFVPKKLTPWSEMECCSVSEFKRKFLYLKERLNPYSEFIKFQFDSSHEISRQAYLSRVGSELADDLEKEARVWQEKGVKSSGRFPDTDL